MPPPPGGTQRLLMRNSTASNGPTNSGTPDLSSPPNFDKIHISLTNKTGPVKSAKDTHAWLSNKGWILTGDKLVGGLSTTRTSEMRVVMLSIAYLLKENTKEAASISANTLNQIIDTAEKLHHSADFLNTASTKQAENILTLGEVSDKINASAKTLNKTASSSPQSLPSSCNLPPTWAWIASCNTPGNSAHQQTSLLTILPGKPKEITKLCQKIIQDQCTILVEIDKDNITGPADTSPTGTSAL
ncbi:hypothetical protein H0H87_012071 [Tephrocybe sp. NHM501043]|nr:hypothetical protein H0H87_012071 [Tephrocybe sp. NHM501043]